MVVNFGVKYSILIPYINRARQFNATLLSYKHFYSNRNDFEIVVVEDMKNRRFSGEPEAFQFVVSKFNSAFPFRIFELDIGDSWNPSRAYNFLCDKAVGEFIVLTNPECVHLSDILSRFDTLFAKNENSYPCCCVVFPVPNKELVIPENDFNELSYVEESKKRTVYQYCSAMKKSNFIKLGGFDEAYMDGVSAEDADFADRVGKYCVLLPDMESCVLHLPHTPIAHCVDNVITLANKNKDLLGKKREERLLARKKGD